jgi:hypothetical protein
MVQSIKGAKHGKAAKAIVYEVHFTAFYSSRSEKKCNSKEIRVKNC